MDIIWKKKYELTTQPKVYSLPDFFAMTALISMLGFIVEDVWMLVRSGFIDNRNMNLPFLLGYGIAVVGMYLLIGTPKKGHLFLYFSIVFFIISLGEILLGKTFEKMCGFYYWDYTNLPFHFTRYTSLFTSLGFSAIIMLFMYFCYEPVMQHLHDHKNKRKRRICIAVFVLMILDMFYSFHLMHQAQNIYRTWKISFHAPII